MMHRTALVFVLSFIFAVAALPVWRVGSSEGPELEFIGSECISEVTNVALLLSRSTFDIDNDGSRQESLLERRDSAGKTTGEVEVQDTSGTSHRSTRNVLGLVGMAIMALFGLGMLGAVLYVARSRVRRSKEMLEMLPRVQKADNTSCTVLEDEEDDAPSEVDLLDWSGEHDDASDIDLIILSESEGDADTTEDLIYFDEGDNHEQSKGTTPPTVDSNRVILTGLPFSITHELVAPDSPNPWVLPSASESPTLLLIPMDDTSGSSAQETPFATALSSPALELVCLGNEPGVTERRWTAMDLALMMQFRPGLGVGAEFAWMVRLLMGVFGWITVLLIR